MGDSSKHEFSIGQHDAKISRLETDVREIRNDVHEIMELLTQSKGAWRVIVLIASLSAAIGGFAINYILGVMK